MTTDLTGATGSHSSHIVICIIIIYYVCCGRLIYRSAFGSCLRVRASEEWEIALTLTSQFTDHHSGCVAVSGSKQQL